MRKSTILIIAAAIALFSFGAKKGLDMTRGLRNKNPFNIRKSNDNWDGLDEPRDDGEFFRFKDVFFGIRAGAKLLFNYQKLHGLKTVRQMISRFAPASENDTNTYIGIVSSALGVMPDQSIDASNPATLVTMAKAIIKHENGLQPYDDATIQKAVQAALV